MNVMTEYVRVEELVSTALTSPTACAPQALLGVFVRKVIQLFAYYNARSGPEVALRNL